MSSITGMGLGEYEQPGAAGSRFLARGRFLQAVRRIVPDVLDDLAGEPYALYEQLAQATELPDRAEWQEYLSATPDSDAALVPLRDNLQSWAQRWHLETDWCLERALDTLGFWHRWPGSYLLQRKWGGRGHAFWHALNAEERCFTFTHPGWEPTEDTRANAARAIRAEFKKRLSEYLDEIDHLARHRGYVPTPKKRVGDDHFDWLVMYQVQELSYPQIARRVCLERQSVTDGIKDAARLIDLPLRPPSPVGRPRARK